MLLVGTGGDARRRGTRCGSSPRSRWPCWPPAAGRRGGDCLLGGEVGCVWVGGWRRAGESIDRQTYVRTYYTKLPNLHTKTKTTTPHLPERRGRVHVRQALLRPRGPVRLQRLHHRLHRGLVGAPEALLHLLGQRHKLGEGLGAVDGAGPGGEQQLLRWLFWGSGVEVGCAYACTMDFTRRPCAQPQLTPPPTTTTHSSPHATTYLPRPPPPGGAAPGR